MPFDDPSSPRRGAETARATFRVAGRPRLLGEAACALRTFLFRIELCSLNSTDPSSFERLESRMSFEILISRFPCGIFRLCLPSQKPSFLRGDSGGAFFLISATRARPRASDVIAAVRRVWFFAG